MATDTLHHVEHLKRRFKERYGTRLTDRLLADLTDTVTALRLGKLAESCNDGRLAVDVGHDSQRGHVYAVWLPALARWVAIAYNSAGVPTTVLDVATVAKAAWLNADLRAALRRHPLPGCDVPPEREAVVAALTPLVDRWRHWQSLGLQTTVVPPEDMALAVRLLEELVPA